MQLQTEFQITFVYALNDREDRKEQLSIKVILLQRNLKKIALIKIALIMVKLATSVLIFGLQRRKRKRIKQKRLNLKKTWMIFALFLLNAM